MTLSIFINCLPALPQSHRFKSEVGFNLKIALNSVLILPKPNRLGIHIYLLHLKKYWLVLKQILSDSRG